MRKANMKLPIYARTKDWLRKNYGLPFPCRIIVVSVGRIPGCMGEFRWHEERGLIRIANNLTQALMAETLLEEYAHAIRHSLPVGVDYEGEPHDGMFWAIYGELVNKWREHCLK